MKRVFNKAIIKITAIGLATCVALVSMPTIQAHAEEITMYAVDDPIYFEDPPMDEPYIADEYDYLDSNMRLSFGRLKAGDYVDYQKATFTNIGNMRHVFSISISQEDMWDVDLPQDNIIDPGATVEVYVRPNLSNPKWNEGDYTGVLTLNGFSASSGTISDTATVNLYVTIYKPASPWVSSVSVSPATVVLSQNSTYTFSASVNCGDGANPGVNWSISGQTSGSTYIDSNGTLYVGSDESSSNITVKATSVQDSSKSGTASVRIAKNQYTVNTQASPTNGGSTAGGGVYDDGSAATVVANPANGFVFSGWFDANNNKVSSDARYMFTVKSSQVLTARFTQNSLRVNTKKNLDKAGNISAGATIMYGGSYTATATVNDGYKFIGWYEGDNLLSNGTSLTLNGITANRELTAVYEQSSYVVSTVVSPANTGTVSGGGKYNKGSKVTLTANPIKGYSFVSWIYNNQAISTDKTLTIDKIDRDYSITAFFKQDNAKEKTYTIGASTDSYNGSITPGGNTTVIEGNTLVISIVPNKNYKIADVKVDGKSVGAVSTYTFYDIRNNHTINASFAKVEAAPAKQPQSSSEVKVEKNKNTEVTGATTEKPTQDEARAVAETSQMTALTGVLQDLNITPDEAKIYIEGRADRALMETALYRGDLQVTVVNKFASVPNETASASYYEIESIPNMADVIDSILTEEQKLELFQGTMVRTNLNIGRMDSASVPEDEKAIFAQNTAGMTIDDFFDIRFIAEVGGVPQLVTTLNEPMRVVMNVSPEMKANGAGKYCVLRVHDGQFDILEDLDDDVDTVTFVTDKMSTFAMAYYNSGNGSETQGDVLNMTSDNGTTTSNTSGLSNAASKNNNGMLVLYIMIGVIIAGIGVITGVAVSTTKKNKKHKKHKR